MNILTPTNFVCLAILGGCFPTICCWGQETVTKEQGAAAVVDSVALGTSGASLRVPRGWVRKEPRSEMIAAEFAIPKVAGDSEDGRLTIMSAGGSIDANIQRWLGQFTAAAGETLVPKLEKKSIADQEVHLIDISGTYQDSSRGPFGPKVERPGYRMLAAIIVLKQGGQHFVKFYGPQATIAQAAPSFTTFLDSLTLSRQKNASAPADVPAETGTDDRPSISIP